MEKKISLKDSRRKFLTRQLPVGAMMCIGCKSLLASSLSLEGLQDADRKSLLNSGMTTEEVFRFAIGTYVPVIQNMEKSLGKKKFLTLLRKATRENVKNFIDSSAKDISPRDMKAFSNFMTKYLATPPFDKGITYEVTENSDKAFEAKFSECIVAKIYREMNLAELGYEMECAPGDAVAKAYNPKMKVSNPKNLMKGDNICIERFELEA